MIWGQHTLDGIEKGLAELPGAVTGLDNLTIGTKRASYGSHKRWHVLQDGSICDETPSLGIWKTFLGQENFFETKFVSIFDDGSFL